MLYDMGGEMCPGSQGDLGEKLPRMVGVEVDIGDDKIAEERAKFRQLFGDWLCVDGETSSWKLGAGNLSVGKMSTSACGEVGPAEGREPQRGRAGRGPFPFVVGGSRDKGEEGTGGHQPPGGGQDGKPAGEGLMRPLLGMGQGLVAMLRGACSECLSCSITLQSLGQVPHPLRAR